MHPLIAPPAIAPPVLAFESVAIGARARDGRIIPLVDGVSFALRRGEVLGLIGGSGAGKSTLGLAAMGYVRRGCYFMGGRVFIHGQDILAWSEERRRTLRGNKIAYVAQSAPAALNPASPLLEQLLEAALAHDLMEKSQALEEINALLAALDLPDSTALKARYLHQMSGGQLQRVMVAMALITKPDLLIFDEPTTALDTTTQIEALLTFRTALARTNSAALYISHDLAVVAQMASSVIVLKAGKIVEQGSTATILNDPRDPYTRSLVRGFTRLASGGMKGDNAAPLLAATNLSAAYRRARKGPQTLVLDDVSFTLGRGECLALIGLSGSGKSTLARLICGLMAPLNGTIAFEGAPLPALIKERPRALLRRIQLIHQIPDLALNPRHSVYETLARPLTLYFGLKGKERDARVSALMDEMELPRAFLERPTGALSGGQKQRVVLARALAANPDVLICDEITSALDRLVAVEILTLLSRLQRERALAMLFITHSLETVRVIAHRVAVLEPGPEGGRIVETGTPDAVLHAPTASYTRWLLDCEPQIALDWLDQIAAKRAAHSARM